MLLQVTKCNYSINVSFVLATQPYPIQNIVEPNLIIWLVIYSTFIVLPFDLVWSFFLNVISNIPLL